jgi:hypothetical protein
MGNQETDIDKYLRLYPYLREWVIECAACHRKGVRSDMPVLDSNSTNVTRVKLRRLLSDIDLDERGLCEPCRAAQSE